MSPRVAAAAAAAILLTACGGGSTAANNGAAAAQAVSPVRNVLTEFDRVCSQAMDRDAYVAAAPGAGWERFEPTPDSPLGRLIAMGQNAVREASAQLGQPGEASSENAAFRKTANGRELVLLISLIQVPGMERSLECRVYDFTAPAPTDAEIAAWTTTRPEKATEQGITAYGWRPGFRQGFSRIDVTHLDPASPLRAQIPVTGLSVTAFQGPTTD